MISVETTRTLSPAEANDALSAEKRRCGDCETGALRCVKVTEERKNGFYVGRTYDYECNHCGASIERYDGWMSFKIIALQTIGALLLGGFMIPAGLIGAAEEPLMLLLAMLGLLVFASGTWTAYTVRRSWSLVSRSPLL